MSPAVILAALVNASRFFAPQDIPDRAIVEAVIQHESRGRVRVCKDEANGSSSRGPMMINRPASRCGVDDERFARDFDAATNVRHGVYLLALHAKWHREHGHEGHDALEHYAGKGAGARRFAAEVREIARKLRAAEGGNS